MAAQPSKIRLVFAQVGRISLTFAILDGDQLWRLHRK